MSASHIDPDKLRIEQEQKILRQIAFASGVFQGDITVRTLLESLAEGVVIVDTSGTILLVNPAAERMFGYAREELVGKPHAVLVPERFRKTHAEDEARYFAEPCVRPMGQLLDLAGLRKDGSEFPVEISLSFLETANGIFVLSFVSDMTLRKQYEMRLHEKDKLFQALVEGVTDYAIFMLDAQGNVLNWNVGAERLKGYREEEIVGRNFSRFYLPEDRKAGTPAQLLNEAAAEGRINAEGWRVRKDGSRFWADVIITALYDETGALRGFSEVTRDITERKQVEEALRKSQQLFSSFMLHLPAAAWIKDLDGRYVYANAEAERIFNLSLAELTGRSDAEIFDPETARQFIENDRRVLAEGGSLQTVEVLRQPDGNELHSIVSKFAVSGLDGRTAFVAGVAFDITERKRAEGALRSSEDRYRALFYDNPVMIVTLDAGMTMLSVNPTCATQLGYAVDELEGQTVLKLFQPDDQPAVIDQLQMCLRNPEQVYRWQFRKIRKDGQVMWVEETARAISDLNGALNLLVVCQNITARKQAEEAQEQMLMQLDAVLNSIAEGVVIADLAGNVLTMNPSALAFHEYESVEQVRRQLSQLVDTFELSGLDGQIVPFDQWPLSRALRGERFVDFEVRVNRKDTGTTRIGSYSGTPVQTRSGDVILAVITVRDITERKQAQAEVERLNADLAARAAELEAFNYTVAHDLRKPLTVVNGYCQVLQEICGARLDEECRGYLGETYAATLRMERLIEALLNFSRMARVELRREAVDLTALAKMTTAELQLAEPQRRMTVRIAEGVRANGDANLLRVVLDNLLGNAWKYTGNCEEGLIEFGMTQQDGVPVFFVRDNGLGFAPEHAEKLFLPFTRLPGAECCQGFGIGLATVDRIIRRHGGRIWAEGELGRGATFYFTLGLPEAA